MKAFYNLSRVFAAQVWDTMLQPLIAKEEFRRRFGADDVSHQAWRSLVGNRSDSRLSGTLKNDLVRGLVFTDAKIGVLTHPHDLSLLQNRCFIYHLIGNKTGEWKSAGRWHGCGGTRTGAGSAERRRGNTDKCRASRAGPGEEGDYN